MPDNLEYERFLINGYDSGRAQYTDEQNFEHAKTECIEKLLAVVARIKLVTFEKYQRTKTK